MKTKRVGRISMAIVLIALGITIFIAQINNLSAVKLSIKFWPIMLFLIGGEILWYSYKYKDEDVIIKYDVFSIFIVLLIVVVNLGIYGLVETGMMPRLTAMASSQTFAYKLPYNELELNDEIKKIVVDSPNCSNLTVRSGESNKITSSGSIHITADSEEKAKELLDNEYIINHKSGDTLYISFIDNSDYDNKGYSAHPYDFMLTLPENKKVEINGGDDLQLIVDDIKSDWVIDSMNRTKIRLGKDLDLKINAHADAKEMLNGNAKWNITEEKKEGDGASDIKGELLYGNGSSNVYIINSNEITVDELK